MLPSCHCSIPFITLSVEWVPSGTCASGIAVSYTLPPIPVCLERFELCFCQMLQSTIGFLGILTHLSLGSGVAINCLGKSGHLSIQPGRLLQRVYACDAPSREHVGWAVGMTSMYPTRRARCQSDLPGRWFDGGLERVGATLTNRWYRRSMRAPSWNKKNTLT
jgi:hypothetical protein